MAGRSSDLLTHVDIVNLEAFKFENVDFGFRSVDSWSDDSPRLEIDYAELESSSTKI